METIYLDQASTAYPKAPSVARAVYDYLSGAAVNVGRGSYAAARGVEEAVFDTRERLCRLFDFPDPSHVIFTSGVTESLNVLLKGLLRPGDHVLVSSMEHNAVMRPLAQLAQGGVAFDRIPSRPDGSLILEAAEALIRPSTRCLVCLHASNVCGTILPAEQLGALCQRRGIFFILDTAQTAGVLPVSMAAMHIDALAFTGHKGLRGPQGTGGFLVRDQLAQQLEPLLSGGTGSRSHEETMPPFLPDRFEPGTPNLPGILGLRAALEDLERLPAGAVFHREMALTERFLAGLRALDSGGDFLRLAGRPDCRDRCAVVSLQTLRQDPAQAAYELAERFGIMTRVGLHCAPSAHRTLGTFPAGTIRFSFGPENTEAEVDLALEALEQASRPRD